MSAEVEQVLVVRKVSAGSIYKLLFLGLIVVFIPLGVAFGIAACFGADTVKWDRQPIHGAAALLAGPATTALMACVLAGVSGTFTSLGLWLLSRFRTISIRVVVSQPAVHPDAESE